MNANRCERLEDKLDQSNLKEFHKDDVASVYEDYSDKHLVSDFRRSVGLLNYMCACMCLCIRAGMCECLHMYGTV